MCRDVEALICTRMSPEEGALDKVELDKELELVVTKLEVRRSLRLMRAKIMEERAEHDRQEADADEFRRKQLSVVPWRAYKGLICEAADELLSARIARWERPGERGVRKRAKAARKSRVSS